MAPFKLCTLAATTVLALYSPTLGAQELEIEGTFGTPAGCAVINGERSIPDGKVRALASGRALNEEAICTITGLNEPASEDGKTVWEATVTCESGHEQPTDGTLEITLAEDKQSVSLKVLEGAGPKGKLNPCP